MAELNVIRKCILCGDEFKPKSTRQKCCNKPILRPCVICGKDIELICTTAKQKNTCSKECNNKYIKMKQVEGLNSEIRQCKWCGKEFTPTSSRDQYCAGPHYKQCEVCGKQFEINPVADPTVRSCSAECKKILQVRGRDFELEHQHQKETLQRKYGVDNAMQIPGVVDKLKTTNKERYDHEWFTQTQEYKDSVKQTDLDKYGVEHHLQSQEVIAKRTETVKERYGVDNVFQSEEVKSKIKSTMLQEYGVEYISQSPEIQVRIAANNFAKYGVKHPMMLQEFWRKAQDTNEQKFGRRAYTQQHINNIEAWYRFMNDPRKYIADNYTEVPRSAQLAKDLGVDQSTIDVYLAKTDSQDCIRRAKSLMEEEVRAFLQTIVPGTRILQNDRKVIAPLELDIYLPEYKLGIECNPTVTHNSSCDDPWGGQSKPYNYHLKKTNACESNGLMLFHIFSWEWTYQKDIIKSMLANLLHFTQNQIYARNCVVKPITSDDCRIFLDANHRQGGVNSAVRLGLYHNDELVSVMTFGKMRQSIGTDNTDLSDCWELVRFCSKLDTSVVGGASKLFKHFVTTYQPKRIRSFSDRAHTRGNLYDRLGFTEIRRSTPGYVWVDTKTDIAYHRYNAQKQNLQRFLKDDNIDLNKTEKEIMIEHGFVQVFDSGTITWEWTNL